jgi:hypothetical protein
MDRMGWSGGVWVCDVRWCGIWTSWIVVVSGVVGWCVCVVVMVVVGWGSCPALLVRVGVLSVVCWVTWPVM